MKKIKIRYSLYFDMAGLPSFDNLLDDTNDRTLIVYIGGDLDVRAFANLTRGMTDVTANTTDEVFDKFWFNKKKKSVAHFPKLRLKYLLSLQHKVRVKSTIAVNFAVVFLESVSTAIIYDKNMNINSLLTCDDDDAVSMFHEFRQHQKANDGYIGDWQCLAIFNGMLCSYHF